MDWRDSSRMVYLSAQASCRNSNWKHPFKNIFRKFLFFNYWYALDKTR